MQRLLEDARNGKFDCVVVKDLSRFGRDYIETGSYLEHIFPFLGIRFISINDHYDSASYNESIQDLNVDFKNLLYDLYSKDLSQKVKTSLWTRKERGQYISANAPFGYEKSLGDRHMLVICDEEAEVVRKIFSLALQGDSSYQIAKKLNLENIPAPAEFKTRKGKTSRKPKGDKFYWSNSVICSILRNPVYVGDLEYGKTEKEQVGGRNILKPRADWKIIRNHHAPVITRTDFEEIQKSRNRSRRKGKGQESRHMLAGMAVCGCCRHSLQIKKGINPYFTCNNRYVTGLEGCVSKVNVMYLEQVVLFRLEEYMEEHGLVAEEADRYKDNLKAGRDRLLQDMKQAVREHDRLKNKHYENYQLYSLGKQAGFHSLHAEIEKKQEAIQEMQKRISQIDGQIHKAKLEEFIIDKNKVIVSGLVERYISKIIIYSEKNIEIRWKK